MLMSPFPSLLSNDGVLIMGPFNLWEISPIKYLRQRDRQRIKESKNPFFCIYDQALLLFVEFVGNPRASLFAMW